ncbi:hypothetical protein MHYP_G00306980 [Metynnis hypsauchen]
MMMMPVFAGAPWLPKFSGDRGDLKYAEWKEQMLGLLGAAQYTDAQQASIIMGTLVGDAKREVNVLEAGDRDRVGKIFRFLDALYGDQVALPVLRSRFFSCRQRPEESLRSFMLRLKELSCRLRTRDPDEAPSDGQLRDQLLLGMGNGSLRQALKTYVRRNPDEPFAAVCEEAMLMEGEQQGLDPAGVVSHTQAPEAAPYFSQGVWKQAFAVCQRIGVTVWEDDRVGYVWPSSRRGIKVPALSEVVVWGRVRMCPRGTDYCGALSEVGLSFPNRETDVLGACELNLTPEADGQVTVSVVEVGVPATEGESCPAVNDLGDRRDLTPQQQGELQELLRKWNQVFAVDDEDFGRMDTVQHRILTGDSVPIRERFRPLPSAMYKEMRILLAEMIEETLTTLTQSKWFSTLDLASGYWQVGMDPRDREKTAFSTLLGLYEFEHFSSHLQHLDEVFARLWKYGLKLRPDKCKLLQGEVKFLGHVVDGRGVRPDLDKLDRRRCGSVIMKQPGMLG